VNGPSGDGVLDLYTPEINTSAVPDPTTVSVAATDAYDQLKVQAVLTRSTARRLTASGAHRCRLFPVGAVVCAVWQPGMQKQVGIDVLCFFLMWE